MKVANDRDEVKSFGVSRTPGDPYARHGSHLLSSPPHPSPHSPPSRPLQKSAEHDSTKYWFILHSL